MKGIETKKALSPEHREELLGALKARFEKNMNRHKGLEWAKVKAKLEANTEKLWSLIEMERDFLGARTRREARIVLGSVCLFRDNWCRHRSSYQINFLSARAAASCLSLLGKTLLP